MQPATDSNAFPPNDNNILEKCRKKSEAIVA